MMKTTFMQKKEEVVRDWYVIDKDEFVLPMLPPGGAIDDIITVVK